MSRRDVATDIDTQLRIGADWHRAWWATDENGEVPPGFWDGFTARMEIRGPSTPGIAGGGPLLATLTSAGGGDGTLTLEPNGGVVAFLPSSFTATLPVTRRAVYDVELTDPDGLQQTAVEGTILIRKGVTE